MLFPLLRLSDNLYGGVAMKKYKRILFLTSFLFLSIFIISQTGLAQGIWRERIKEKIKERRSQRTEGKRQFIEKPGDYDFCLQHGGLTRTYKVHVPPSYKTTTPTPLILAFHGGGGDSENMANDEYYNLISKSNKEGFIVVFPNGASKLRSGKLATWNAGNCCGYARDNNVDDVGFVKVTIDDLESKLNIDSRKIFAIGMSNGGMFCYRLACDLTDKFKAIASVAGTDNCTDCIPYKPISVMHIHAKDDGHVLFNGGAGKDAFRDISKVTDFTPVPETISRWVKRNHCVNNPKRVLEKDGVYCDLYSGCESNVQVMLCVTENGGHSWPGGQKPREKADTPSNAISVVDEIWEFFKNQSNE